MNQEKLDSKHLLVDMKSLETRDVLERLIRRSQNYKTNLSHAMNTNNPKFDLLQLINGVDYDQLLTDYNASFDV